MDIKHLTADIVTTQTIYSHYVEVVPGLYAYRQDVVTNSTLPGSKTVETVNNGLMKKSHIGLLRKGQTPPQPGYKKPIYFVATPELLTRIGQLGYQALAEHDFKNMQNHSIFDWISGGGSPDLVVGFCSYDHSFWRVDGSILPSGIYFDYIDARMHNGLYDLDRAVAILNARDDVFFPTTRRRVEEITFQPGEIEDVPYYNSEPGRERCLGFFWQPSQEQAEAILAAGSTNRQKTIFDNDYLGLRAGGAALSDNFYHNV